MSEPNETTRELPVDDCDGSMTWISMAHGDFWLSEWQSYFNKKLDEKEKRNLGHVFEYARLGMKNIDDASVIAEQLLSQELRKIADRIESRPQPIEGESEHGLHSQDD